MIFLNFSKYILLRISKPTPEFIIYSPRFNANSGGNVVLYDLARRLRDKGYKSSIWIDERPAFSRDYFSKVGRSPLRFFVRWVRYILKKYNLPHDLRSTSWVDRENDIVVYPEITPGNPLGVRKVVRWILYFPGSLAGAPSYGPRDLFFIFAEVFANKFVPPGAQTFCLPLAARPFYRQYNFSERHGDLVLIRKGRNRSQGLHPKDAQRIDDKGHEELCSLFNRAKKLYSYDLYTAYNIFASICGCIPIVLPADGVSEEEWLPDITDRYGIAYGEERISFALGTRALLLAKLTEDEAKAEGEMEKFLEKVSTHFGTRLMEPTSIPGKRGATEELDS